MRRAAALEREHHGALLLLALEGSSGLDGKDSAMNDQRERRLGARTPRDNVTNGQRERNPSDRESEQIAVDWGLGPPGTA